MTNRRLSLYLIISVSAGILLGALIAYLGAGLPLREAGGFTLTGWAAASLLLTICIFLILLAWNWAGRLKSVLIIMLVAFALRLGIGVTLGLGLDKWGHFNMENEAGYLFLDPYRRDTDAWRLAQSGDSFIDEFRKGFSNDQYGGLLTTSAFIYRTLSPDGHRPFLILILTAFAGAIGIPFLWKAIEPRWKKRVALIACLIVAFYPEAIVQGSSQTREPFLIALFSIAFWAVLTWKEHRWKSAISLTASLLMLAFVNTLAAVVGVGFLGIWFVLDQFKENENTNSQKFIWIGIVAAALVISIVGWFWLKEVAKWDALVSYHSSGFVEMVIKKIGKQWLLPFVTLYGLTQPLLPAALIAHSAKPLWTSIAIFRSIGWYALLPLLLYALIVVWKVKNPKEKRLLVWTMLFSVVWIVISSLRAGGDEWDNPRYRIIFLPLLALLAAWAIDWARQHRDSWLVCLLVIEGVFLVIFVNLYLVRYLGIGIRIPWYWDIVLFIGISVLLIVGNFLLQKKRRKS
jgi:hypothetical protein